MSRFITLSQVHIGKDGPVHRSVVLDNSMEVISALMQLINKTRAIIDATDEETKAQLDDDLSEMQIDFCKEFYGEQDGPNPPTFTEGDIGSTIASFAFHLGTQKTFSWISGDVDLNVISFNPAEAQAEMKRLVDQYTMKGITTWGELKKLWKDMPDDQKLFARDVEHADEDYMKAVVGVGVNKAGDPYLEVVQ